MQCVLRADVVRSQGSSEAQLDLALFQAIEKRPNLGRKANLDVKTLRIEKLDNPIPMPSRGRQSSLRLGKARLDRHIGDLKQSPGLALQGSQHPRLALEMELDLR